LVIGQDLALEANQTDLSSRRSWHARRLHGQDDLEILAAAGPGDGVADDADDLAPPR
jgi:hypothetical protein